MNKEELDKIQVGDKVVFFDDEESIVVVINHDTNNGKTYFACPSESGVFILEQYKIDYFKSETANLLVENIEDYVGQKFYWFTNFKNCEFKNSNKPTQSNKCGKCGLFDEYAAFSKKHNEVRCYRCC